MRRPLNALGSAILQNVLEKLDGKIDILVLNHVHFPAFGEWVGSSDNLTLHNKLMDVNYNSYVYLASYFLPHLEKTAGQIIVLSSTSGRVFNFLFNI